MKRVLIIATIYRCGEKIYPIIPYLCNDYEVDVLMFNQMSNETPWLGDIDPRPDFYEWCKRCGAKVIQGMGFDKIQKNYENGKILSFGLVEKKYDIIIIDDNKFKPKWGTLNLCLYLRSVGNKIIGSPHGNYEFSLQNLNNNIGSYLDYSFVFGEKEKSKFSNKIINRLIPGGIPSNDNLSKLNVLNKYILIFTGFVKGYNFGKNALDYKAFNEETFLNSGILEIQKKESIPIIIKEKSRFQDGLCMTLKNLEKYEGVSVIMDHCNNDELISGAKYVIAAPSTLAFKSIQMGVPTVLLNKFGMTGNFYDFIGLSEVSCSSIKSKLENQLENGKCSEFIINTISGGLNFNSTEIHIKAIKEIIDGRKEF